MTSKNSFFKNITLNLSGNISVIFLGLFTSVIIARSLGPDGQGIFTLIILLPTMLVTFMNFGIAPATVYYIGSKKYALNVIVNTNIFLSIVISLCSIVLGSLAIIFLENNVFVGVPLELLYLVLVTLPFLFFNSFIQAIYQGIQNFKMYNFINVINKVIQLLYLIVVSLFLVLNVEWVLYSFIVSSILPTILLFVYMKRDNLLIEEFTISRDFIKDSLNYGFKAHISNIVTFFNYRVDIIMISFFLSPFAVGIYNIAVLIAEKLWVFSQPISVALFPKISSTERDDEKSRITSLVTRNVLFLSLIFAVVFYTLAEFMIILLFGNEYVEAVKPILILLIGITIFSGERIMSNDLAGRGKPELNLYTSLFTLGCNIILNIILIPKYGINGAAIATTTSYVLTFIIKLHIFSRITNMKKREICFIQTTDLKMYIKLLSKVRKPK